MRRDYKLFLKDIINAMDAIERFVEGMKLDDLVKDDKTSSAVIRKFEIIGEAVRNIPDWLREKYPQIQWRRMVGMRDRLIHGYFGIDYELIWEAIKIEIPNVRPELQKILREMDKEE